MSYTKRLFMAMKYPETHGPQPGDELHVADGSSGGVPPNQLIEESGEGTAEEGAALAAQKCHASTGGGRYHCQLAAGHGGRHQNGLTEWVDVEQYRAEQSGAPYGLHMCVTDDEDIAA